MIKIGISPTHSFNLHEQEEEPEALGSHGFGFKSSSTSELEGKI